MIDLSYFSLKFGLWIQALKWVLGEAFEISLSGAFKPPKRICGRKDHFKGDHT